MLHILEKRVLGATLIEVIVSMALFSAIVLYTTPFYCRFLFLQEVSLVQDALESSIAKAQLYSMEGRYGDEWSIIEDNHQLVLFRGGDYEQRNRDFDELSISFPSVALNGLEAPIFFSRVSGEAKREADITLTGSGLSVRLHVNHLGILNQE